MITLEDLDAAIAECIGERNPTANTCYKLAAYYIIKRELYGEQPSYSYTPAPVSPETIPVDNLPDTAFGRAIDGKEMASVIEVMDELMAVVQAIQPRLYDGVLKKLKEI